MTTPDDFPRHRPAPEEPTELLKPGKGIGTIALFVVGALVVLGVMVGIAAIVL